MRFERWDIWWADVPFDDGSGEKRRPVVILDDKTVFVIGLYTTSSSPRPGHRDYAVSDWEQAGLTAPSTIRLSPPLKIKADRFVKRIGRLSERDIAILAFRGQFAIGTL